MHNDNKPIMGILIGWTFILHPLDPMQESFEMNSVHDAEAFRKKHDGIPTEYCSRYRRSDNGIVELSVGYGGDSGQVIGGAAYRMECQCGDECGNFEWFDGEPDLSLELVYKSEECRHPDISGMGAKANRIEIPSCGSYHRFFSGEADYGEGDI